MHSPDIRARKSLYYDYKVYPFDAPGELKGELVQHPLVIVGAGPIGMAMALDLARYDIPVVILEAAVQVSEGSRAIVFTYRSMEILQQVGVADQMMESALPWRAGNSFYRGQRVFRMEAPTNSNSRYAPMNNLQQQYVEEYMVGQIEQNPLIDLRWGSKVIGIPHNDERTIVRVDTPEGEYELQTDWLVAADGAHSPVRSLLGLRLEGDSFEGHFVIADIEIEIDLPTERLAFFDPDWNPGNTVLMHREPGNIWRIDYQLPKGETPEQALEPELLRSRIQAQLDMVGINAPWEIDWSSVYSARAMTLQSYIHNRVCFAGDSAHMLPIFGVRGANTGWQDGHNLVWKLAAYIKGWGARALLDSYSQERVASAWEIIDEASKSTRFMTPPSDGYKLLRNATLSLSLSQDFVRPLYHWRTSRPHNYLTSALNTPCQTDSGGLVPGYPVANVKLSDQNYLMDHMGASFYLLCFSADGNVDQALIEATQAIRDQGVPLQIMSITPATTASDGTLLIHDPQNNSEALYDSSHYSTYLVRPDQHICARWSALTAEQLQQAVLQATGCRGQH